MSVTIKSSSYLLLVHLMSFFLFGHQLQIKDPHTSVEGSQRYSVKINTQVLEDFLNPF